MLYYFVAPFTSIVHEIPSTVIFPFAVPRESVPALSPCTQIVQSPSGSVTVVASLNGLYTTKIESYTSSLTPVNS